MHRSLKSTILLVLVLGTAPASADKLLVEGLVDKPDSWFYTEEGKRVVNNIVSWQNPWGGWLKQYDASIPRPAQLPSAEPAKGVPPGDGKSWQTASTFDNDGTTSELRILARAFRVTGDKAYLAAFNTGLEFVYKAQYPNGGWPQRYPMSTDYGRHITFNDNAMLNVVRLLQDIAAGKPDFAFLSDSTRVRATTAVNRAMDCILNAQIRVNGKLTAWCQQHDSSTLAPTAARTYELPSICTFESAHIVLHLMELPSPDDRVKAAIAAAVEWFEQTRILGMRYERTDDPKLEFGVDRRLIKDPSAPQLWARFYDIETNRPFFCNRDGIKRWSFEEVDPERRARYAWFNTAPQRVLDAYPKWRAAHGQ